MELIEPRKEYASNLVLRARVYATAAHHAVGQRRKYTNDPYIVHPAEVVGLLEEVGADEFQLAAGWLHDVVEDTQVKIEDIWGEFGSVVSSYVHWLTNPSRPEDGNRATRKRRDRDYIANAPAAVKTVKLADLISNSRSILEHDAKFARVYLREKQELLEVLGNGNEVLYRRAQEIVQLALKGV